MGGGAKGLSGLFFLPLKKIKRVKILQFCNFFFCWEILWFFSYSKNDKFFGNLTLKNNNFPIILRTIWLATDSISGISILLRLLFKVFDALPLQRKKKYVFFSHTRMNVHFCIKIIFTLRSVSLRKVTNANTSRKKNGTGAYREVSQRGKRCARAQKKSPPWKCSPPPLI